MNYWLYQMAAYGDAKDDAENRWRPKDYRREVSVDESVTWEGDEPMNIMLHGDTPPAPGDKTVFFFCKSGLKEKEKPGIYGLGEIEHFRNNSVGRYLRFKAVSPTNTLKKKPLWGHEVRRLMSRIRGKWKQRTMWQMTASQFNELYAMMLTADGMEPCDPNATEQHGQLPS